MSLPELTDNERIGQALGELLSCTDLVMLCPEGEDEEPGYRLTWTVGCERRTFSRDTLLGVLVAALNQEPERLCRRCGNQRPLAEFAKNRNDPQGRCRYCRRCERARVKAYDDGKKRRHAA